VRPSATWRNLRIPDPLLVLFLCACSGAGVLLGQTTEGLDRGRSLYHEHCIDCHGATGKGDGSKSPFLSPRPGNLISAATSAKTDKELLRIIAQGKSRTAMPAWQDVLPADDQQAVLQYIRSLIRFTRQPSSPAATP
jgi:mono/diheme cytochrome c family protein